MLSEANVWSRFEFQQLYQSSPLLSPNCFSLKQIPVLNLNCKDSLGFPGYILHKKTFFFPTRLSILYGLHFQVLRHLIFRCPSGLLCIFSNVCIIFLFVAKVACFASFQKCLHHFSFRCPNGLGFPDEKKVCVIVLFIAQVGFFGASGGQLGFWLEGLGARLGILWDPSRLGSFGGPSFFWDFGNTLNFGGPSFLGRP